MEPKTYLNRYRVCVDRVGLPVVIRRSADEATLKADDLESHAQVALQLQPAGEFGAADREQLETEARAAQQINHSNIPLLHDFGFDDDELFYVTEYLEGTTAEDWIKLKGPMPVGAVLRIASQVVSALVAASLHGIIHYAVHPGNIMLVPGEATNGDWPLIKLLNLLGMAPPLSSHIDGSSSLNMADFASPEQLQDGPVTFRSEIYSLGCMLWFLLKGEPLTDGAATVQNGSELPAPIRHLLAGMLAENPADRPSEPAALHQQISDCLAQLERSDVTPSEAVIPTALPSIHEVEPLPPRQFAWKAVALAALLIALVPLAAFLLPQRWHQNFATEIASASQAAAIPSVTEKPIEQATAAPLLTSDFVASENMPNESLPESAPFAEAQSSAQTADIPISTPALAEMPLASPPQENLEQPAAVVASNSTSSDHPIAITGTAIEQLPMIKEAPPPAEAPPYSDKPIVEFSPVEPTAPAEEEVAKNIPAPSPAASPQKISKPERSAKPATKKATVVTTSAPVESNAPFPRTPYRRTVVGHIFFPSWPETRVNETLPASPPPREEPRRSPRPVQPAAKKAPVAPPLPPA